MDNVLKETKLYEIFSNEFLFFDEYILSGTILRNFDFYAKLICKNVKYKIGTYITFADNLEKLENMQFSLYSKTEAMEAYKKGVYPYEDRIDLIGYFYYITENEFIKVDIKNIYEKCENKEEELNSFIKEMYEFIEKNNILELLREKCKIIDLAKYFEKEDIIRYIIKTFEQITFGTSKMSKFLDEAFELYAPIWVPMPKEYHYEYWKSLVKVQDKLDIFINQNKEKYKSIRKYLIKKLSEKFDEKCLQNSIF